MLHTLNHSRKIFVSAFSLWLSGLSCVVCLLCCTEPVCAETTQDSCQVVIAAHSESSDEAEYESTHSSCCSEPVTGDESSSEPRIASQSEASSCPEVAVSLEDKSQVSSQSASKTFPPSCNSCYPLAGNLALTSLPQVPEAPALGPSHKYQGTVDLIQDVSTNQTVSPHLPSLGQTYLKCCVFLI